MNSAAPTPTLRYGAMRLRWCGLALKGFIARWGVYMLVTGVVLSAGASGWERVLQAIAAMLVLPLFSASQHGWLLLPVMLAQALAGAAAVWGARSLLWAPHWAESERALPLLREEVARSDLLVVLLVLTPLFSLYVAGTASVLAQRPAWLAPTLARALAALTLSALLSLGLGLALLRRLRSNVTRGSATRREEDRPTLVAMHASVLPAWRALILLPLWRGPARRTGTALVLSFVLLVLTPMMPGVLGWPEGWPWLLAAWAALALLAATRINHLARLELAELLDACRIFPLDSGILSRAVSALGLLPLLPGLAAVSIGIGISPPPGSRAGVLLAWAAACVLACVIEVFAGGQPASDKAARWLFSLVVCACLASEVIA